MSKVTLPDAAFRRPVLAVGTTGAGKSYNQCGARVIPALQREEQVVIVDPTDAWFGINFLPDGKRHSNFDVPIFGGEHGHMPLTPNMGAAIGELLGRQKLNAILSLKHMDDSEQVKFVGEMSKALLVHNRKPLHYIIDEADEFCPQLVDRSSREVQICKRQIKRIVTRGRKSGFRPVLITQRPQALDTAVRNQCQVLVALQLMGAHERKMLDDYVKSNGDPAQVKDMLATLAQLDVGEAWIWVPRERYLERVKFPRIPVFDSFDDDESAFEPQGAVSIDTADLTRIQEALGEYLMEQKENDPDELRRRIAELERERAQGPDQAAVDRAYKDGYDTGKMHAPPVDTAHERALSDLRKENEWRPMDTVPPTGEFMCLAYCERYDAVCEVIRYSNRPTWYTFTANGLSEAQPTKWMPKPPPPTSGSPDNG